MVSKNEIKIITSLRQKKYRKKHQLFVAEGIKLVKDLLRSGFILEKLYCTDEISSEFEIKTIEIVKLKDLERISNLKTPSSVVALFKIPVLDNEAHKGLVLVLDGVKDPGNLGTIIRLCDWFGISKLICSEDTVDCYNPKVVQATMGSLARVAVIYTDLIDFLKKTKGIKYATMMQGESIYQEKIDKNAIIIMGNEANGIRENIVELVDKKITIPKFGEISGAESLNVAMATAVILSEIRR